MELHELLALAEEQTRQQGLSWTPELATLIQFGTQSPNWAAFAKQGQRALSPTSELTSARKFLATFCRSYWLERTEKLTLKTVGTVADPAVDIILSAFAGMTQPETLNQAQVLHRQSMAAENLLGALLERYLAQILEANGWVWCAGNTIRAVDFIRRDLQLALQIKNRSNSENSSSAAIRMGTTIQKWYRVHATTGHTNWSSFPANLPTALSEEGFYDFIRTYARTLE